MKKLREYLPRVGMRTVKTALAALICLLIYYPFGQSEKTLPIITAIMCMQSSVEESWIRGKERLYGTVAGALFGMLLLLLIEQIGNQIINFFIIALGILILIAVLNWLKLSGTISISCLVFLVIVLKQNETHPMIYSLTRLFDSSVGIVVALAVNRFVKSPPPLEEQKKERETEEMQPDDEK